MNNKIELYLKAMVCEVEEKNTINCLEDVNVSVNVNRNETMDKVIHCNVLVKNLNGELLFNCDLTYYLECKTLSTLTEELKEEIIHLLQDKINQVVGFIGIESCKILHA